jgi:hypothetical protein
VRGHKFVFSHLRVMEIIGAIVAVYSGFVSRTPAADGACRKCKDSPTEKVITESRDVGYHQTPDASPCQLLSESGER